MKFTCFLCAKDFTFDPEKIPEAGFRINCPVCGTKTTVQLPPRWRRLVQDSPELPEPPESKGRPAGDNRYILLADDTAFFRTMMSDLLISHGHMVKTAADGQEALEIYEAAPDLFGLILLDLQMPRMSGFDVLEHLSKSAYPAPPVIVMTGVHDSHEDIQMVREKGAAAFLDKSLDPSAAYERIEMVLDQAADPDSE